MEQTAHVFGEFNQADDSIIRKYGGTGLGLSISKKLVEMQEGSLTLRSVPNEGTTFSIVLPMQRVAAPETEAIPQPQLSGTDVLAGKAVLVIDDDAYSRTLCQLILGRKGMQVTLANDGQEALQLIKEKRFDMVLTDIQLPGMSGKAVARAIRKENATIPIMALTANIMSSNKRFFAKTGISEYLLKPFTEQDLYLKLSKILSTQPIPEVIPENEGNAEAAGIAAPKETAGITESETKGKPEQTSEPIPAPYTLDELRTFVGDDQEALWDIVEVLVTDNRRSLAQLENAAAAANWQQAGELAHKMKTAFRHLQAHTVLPALDALELVLHQPDLPTDELAAIAEQLQQEAKLVLTALEAELTRYKKPQETAA